MLRATVEQTVGRNLGGMWNAVVEDGSLVEPQNSDFLREHLAVVVFAVTVYLEIQSSGGIILSSSEH